jgi:hypothetical protein
MTAAAIRAAELLCEVAECGEERFPAAAFGGVEDPAMAALVFAGLLTPAGVVKTLVCQRCDAPHPAEIQFDPDQGRHWWLCPSSGQQWATEADVAALSFDPVRLAARLDEALADAFESRKWRPKALVEGRASTLGCYRIGTAETIVVLAHRLDESDAAAAVAQAITASPRWDAGLILTTGEAFPLPGLPDLYGALPLDQVLSIALDGAVAVDAELLRREAARLRARKQSRRGGPAPHRTGQILKVLRALFPQRPPTRPGPKVVRDAWPRYFDDDPPSTSLTRDVIGEWWSAQR